MIQTGGKAPAETAVWSLDPETGEVIGISSEPAEQLLEQALQLEIPSIRSNSSHLLVVAPGNAEWSSKPGTDMTLKDLEDIGDGGGSSSSSSSGSGSGYPKFNSKVPTFAIWEEDGELVSGWNPQNQFLEYKKEENSSWELHAIPEEMERHWMEKLDLQRTVKMMEEEFNVDGMELLIERPERGLKIARKAAKRHSPQETTWDEESCPVCGEDLHIRYDDYEVIDRRRVCSSHNVAELKEAGLLD